MKTLLALLLVIISISGVDGSEKDTALVKEAEDYMKGAIVVADNWLAEFDRKGYALYLDHYFPPPFEKAIFESRDSIKNKEQFQNWINQEEQEFGKVMERKLLGVHIITKGKLLTHQVNGPKGFRYTSPKLLGLKTVSQMYPGNIEGTYAYFMYESKPAKKDRAEELMVLWLDENNKWNLITYKIADDI
jgi:hypothetical protein